LLDRGKDKRHTQGLGNAAVVFALADPCIVPAVKTQIVDIAAVGLKG
jgi:hypothetical protein